MYKYERVLIYAVCAIKSPAQIRFTIQYTRTYEYVLDQFEPFHSLSKKQKDFTNVIFIIIYNYLI